MPHIISCSCLWWISVSSYKNCYHSEHHHLNTCHQVVDDKRCQVTMSAKCQQHLSMQHRLLIMNTVHCVYLMTRRCDTSLVHSPSCWCARPSSPVLASAAELPCLEPPTYSPVSRPSVDQTYNNHDQCWKQVSEWTYNTDKIAKRQSAISHAPCCSPSMSTTTLCYCKCGLNDCGNKKHLKNVEPICHYEPPHALILHCHSPSVATVARRHCRTPPAHRCPRQLQRQRVTEGTAMAP